MPLDNTYEIYIEKKLQKILKKNLPKQFQKIFNRKLNYFKNNLNHPSLNTKPYNVSSKKLKALKVDEVYENLISAFTTFFFVKIKTNFAKSIMEPPAYSACFKNNF